MVAVLFIVFLVALAIGVPVAFSLGLASVAYMLGAHIQMINFAQYFFKGLDSFTLLCIPGFTFAGNLMNQGGISEKLLDFADALVGHITGGLAYANVLASMVFAGISGTALSDTVALGGVEIPMMVNQGYDVPFSVAITAASSCLGPIIPPSVPMIMAATMTGLSVSKMFMAGIIPGILIAVGLSVMHFFLCRNLKTEGLDWSLKTFIHSLRDGFWSILAPVIILGGIYAGIFTPTEAAVVAIFYTILVGIFIHKELTLKSFMASLKTTSWLTGRVLVLVFTATAFGYLLTSYRIPVEIANWILSFTNNVNLVWFFVVILLLFLGMFMETLAIIMLVTPVLLPIMTAYGVDPIHFGIILICCCGIGFSTPPLGENMFIASGIANISLEEISLKALPLVAINIAVIAILVMFPDIVLFLPNLMGTGLQ